MMKIILIRFNPSYNNTKIRIKKKLRNFTNLKQIQTLRKMVNKSNKKLKKFNGINKKKHDIKFDDIAGLANAKTALK